MKEDDEYKVGPKRPPREHQFRKGQSGNPRGRPRGSLNLQTVLLDELSAEVGIKNGKSIPAIRAILRRLVRKAAEGDLRAIESVLDRAERAERQQSQDQTKSFELPEDDAAILKRAGFAAPIDTPLGGRSEDEDDEGDLVDD